MRTRNYSFPYFIPVEPYSFRRISLFDSLVNGLTRKAVTRAGPDGGLERWIIASAAVHNNVR